MGRLGFDESLRSKLKIAPRSFRTYRVELNFALTASVEKIYNEHKYGSPSIGARYSRIDTIKDAGLCRLEMILTGSEIAKVRKAGRITIEPYSPTQLNPNSYDFRLGTQLGVPVTNGETLEFDIINLPVDGFVLEPRTMYLGHTLEKLGSDTYAMRLMGRSSLGRLGLFLQVSADLGHTGACHQWTLEIVAALPFKIYPKMRIGQISFWKNFGTPRAYEQRYAAFNTPTPSRINTKQRD